MRDTYSVCHFIFTHSFKPIISGLSQNGLRQQLFHRCRMIRFFFDYTTRDQSLLDYQGQEFRSPQGAIEFAETIAENLTHSLSSNWVGWSVEIRNADGKKLSKIPVGMLQLDAA